MSRLPSLNALKTFEAVARLGGMNAAARELCVTESAVSRQVRLLETELGLPLFRRVHRGLVLTAKGQELAATLRDVFGLLASGVERLTRPAERLTVRSPPTFGIRWLMPRLPRFEALHPGWKVEINITWHDIRPDTLTHDVGIRCGPGTWPSKCITPLMVERLTPVCSPRLLETWPLTRSTADLGRAPLLHCSCPGGDWLRWARAWGGEPFSVDRGETFDMLDLALRAAEAGRGIAMADLTMIEDDLALGRLVAPFVDRVVPGEAYVFVQPDPERDSPLARAFGEWLAEEARRPQADIPRSIAVPEMAI
ncbi:LysR substrate-binding domain-containing protein [Microvirga rosea]|uniref:LysR substrate-binding domain-containing protein n=1 Tax=Microvirga rosea TaxID=2715425 RepID=UPI001D09A6FB|nr:LysR substrate-binding domain-containing protein [Microvirga rosea]MCB8819194.1 LysR family transcriptional regulator [Microvirga rosea]